MIWAMHTAKLALAHNLIGGSPNKLAGEGVGHMDTPLGAQRPTTDSPSGLIGCMK